ncbi:MAG: LysR family transcriptional regulator [Niastella sp.]|nr:LysR family transcriptional regulator [Niastella sp.]
MKKSVKHIFKKGKYKVNGSLWIEGDGTRFWGPGPVELLGHIDATGSINQAAQKMGMSYKKAWEIVNRLNGMATNPMVITATGGEKGGGSSISAEAKEMIAYHKGLRERFKQFLEEETKQLMK